MGLKLTSFLHSTSIPFSKEENSSLWEFATHFRVDFDIKTDMISTSIQKFPTRLYIGADNRAFSVSFFSTAGWNNVKTWIYLEPRFFEIRFGVGSDRVRLSVTCPEMSAAAVNGWLCHSPAGRTHTARLVPPPKWTRTIFKKNYSQKLQTLLARAASAYGY